MAGPSKTGGAGPVSANAPTRGPVLPQRAAKRAANLAPVARSATYGPAGYAASLAPMQTVDKAPHERLFGLNMKRARELADGMSQKQLGILLGVSRNEVNRWENSRREPLLKTRLEIADALNQPLSFFYDERVLEEENAA